jgi:hypothetical protein
MGQVTDVNQLLHNVPMYHLCTQAPWRDALVDFSMLTVFRLSLGYLGTLLTVCGAI